MRRSPDFWMPLSFQPQIELGPSFLIKSDAYWLSLIGRLHAGTTQLQAQAATTLALRQFLTGSSSPLSERRKLEAGDARVELVDGMRGVSGIRETYAQPLQILLAVVALVLVMACANVGSLLLSRSAARHGEISLRMALGAGRMRLVRQFLTESLLLAGLGAAGGLLLSRWVTDGALASMVGRGSPVQATLNRPVLTFTIAVTAFAAILFGLLPALSVGRTDLVSGLKSIRAGRTRRRRMPIEPLVIGQVAISLVLLVGANLFAATLLNLEHQSLGFDQDRVILVRMFPKLGGYSASNVEALYRAVYERLNALPGVRSATIASYSPMSGTSSHQSGAVEGYGIRPGEKVDLEPVLVGPAYPATLGMPLLEGRAIGVQDTAGRAQVGMVNEAFVRQYLPDGNPIGRHFGVSGSHGSSGPTDIEIVGVLGDAQFHDIRDPVKPIVFTALLQNANQAALDGEVEVRTAAGPAASPNDVRKAILEVDPNLPLNDPRTLEAQVSSTLNSQRLAGRLVTCFGGLALLLACVGLYGIVAQTVARRTPEIAVRMALGASRRHVVWMFLRHTLLMLAIGLGIGIPLAVGAARLVASQLYGLRATDPASFLLASVVLSAVAILTGLLPARRATRVDPLTVLRSE